MRIRTILGVLATTSLVALSASAEEGPGCRDEIHKLCPGMQKGDGKLRECVKAHKSELSPDCQQKLAQRHEKMQALLAVCADDLKQKCNDIVPGGGRKIMCLAAHEPTLAPACATAIKHGRQKHHAMKACHDDAQALCPNIPRGEGRLKACLEAHRAHLSPACGAALQG